MIWLISERSELCHREKLYGFHFCRGVWPFLSPFFILVLDVRARPTFVVNRRDGLYNVRAVCFSLFFILYFLKFHFFAFRAIERRMREKDSCKCFNCFGHCWGNQICPQWNLPKNFPGRGNHNSLSASPVSQMTNGILKWTYVHGSWFVIWLISEKEAPWAHKLVPAKSGSS